MSKLFERLLNTLAALSAVAIAFMALAICYEVILRQFFGMVPIWVNDITAFLLLTITFAGGAYVLGRNGHTRVDILIGMIRGRPRAVLDLVASLLGLAAAAVLTWAATYAVIESYESGTRIVRALVVPKWVVLMPIVIGSALVAIKFLQIAWWTWRERVRNSADHERR